MTSAVTRPLAGEYGEFYAGYINRVPEGEILEILAGQLDETLGLLSGLTPEQADYRYAPDQWSIKEMLGHINDTERIMSYRALRISRGDETPLPGFEQDSYVLNGDFSARDFQDLVREFEYLRRANLLTFKVTSDEISQRRGTASGNPITVRALLYIMVGHLNFHLESLRNEYLPNV